jgi:hypothetical protein
MPLVNVQEPAGGADDLKAWFFAHHQDHIEIVQAIQKLGRPMTIYPLDPFTPNAVDVWLRFHQSAHNDFNQALGLDGADLTDVDFQNAEKLSDFFFRNYQEHLDARAALGI